MPAAIYAEPKSLSISPQQSCLLHKTRHDIKNAMHIVTGMSHVLTMSDTLTPTQKKAVVLLKKNADLTMELIDDMFASIEADTEESPSQESAAPAGIVLNPSAQKPAALIVEDYEANIFVTGSFLKELGYDYDVAKSGLEAVQKFSAGRYDVIIMDVQMPGMDGLEASRQIRAIEKEKGLAPTPILATTGNATEDDRLFCTKAGMNNYLSKPFNVEDLRRKLNEL